MQTSIILFLNEHSPVHLQSLQPLRHLTIIYSSHTLIVSMFASSLHLSGRLSSCGVWRNEAVCCSACSSSLRPPRATPRASPKRRPVAGCVWGSNAAPTWQPWTSMAIRTPTLKRKEHRCTRANTHTQTHRAGVGPGFLHQICRSINFKRINCYKKKSSYFYMMYKSDASANLNES